MDLFKEVWIGTTFFWKTADILSKGILFTCNDLDCGRFRRGIAGNFPSKKEFARIYVENISRSSGNKMQETHKKENT